MVSSNIFCAFLLGLSVANALDLSISSTGGNVSSSLMYGLMYEDINHSGDGGIYAELIANRAFQGSIEFPPSLQYWTSLGAAELTLDNSSLPLGALPNSVSVSHGNSTGAIGISNSGWWGISVRPQKYIGSFWALGDYAGNFTVKLQSDLTSDIWATTDIPASCNRKNWTQYKFELEPTVAAPNSNNTFSIEFGPSGNGTLNFNLISLFPPTYNNRPNGNRPELMSALKELGGSFFRIPGGNNLEGDEYEIRWMWNKTLGPLIDRPGRPGTWGYENTDGLGLIEYFNWCADLELTPVWAVWSGLYLKEDDYLNSTALVPHVTDALNELEFILGPANSTYGSWRASLGYPEPFPLKFVEIGNEDMLNDGLKSYNSYRFKMFYTAIRGLYPDLTIVASSGDYTAASEGTGTATDFHIYSRPDDFVNKFNLFDNWNRSVPVLIGEYANIQANVPAGGGANFSQPRLKYPLWIGSVAEAIFSIGAERNGDTVVGMSYAPGFQNLNSYEWGPDLISFTADPSDTVLSTSYHVIKLLSNNRISSTVPVTAASSSNETTFGPAYYVAGISSPGHYTFKVATYNATEPTPFNVKFEGVEEGAIANFTILTAPAADSYSSLNLSPGSEVIDVVNWNATTLVAGVGGAFTFELDELTVAVLTT